MKLKVTREHQLKQIESENKLFEEQNKTQEISREKLEKDLRLVSSKKEDLENQFTALTLEKVLYLLEWNGVFCWLVIT